MPNKYLEVTQPQFYLQYFPKVNSKPIYIKLVRDPTHKWIENNLYTCYGILNHYSKSHHRYNGIILLYQNINNGDLRIASGYQKSIYTSLIRGRGIFKHKKYYPIRPTEIKDFKFTQLEVDDNLNSYELKNSDSESRYLLKNQIIPLE
mgnify:CR=1 FL=1